MREIDDYEIICPNCSKMFLADTDEDILCEECWNNYINRQINSQDWIRLTKEYIEILLDNKN